MGTHLKAAVYYGERDTRLEKLYRPEQRPDEVLLDVAAYEICGSDVHEYTSRPLLVPHDEPDPHTGDRLPLMLSHEFAGRAAEVGSEVESVSLDDRATVVGLVTCRTCQYHVSWRHNLCKSVAAVELSGGSNYGMAEHAVVTADQLVPLPDDVSQTSWAHAEPLTVGLHAMIRSELGPDGSATIFGCSPIGLAVLTAAQAAGARQLVVSEPKESQRERAKLAGGDVVIDPTVTDPVTEVDSLTDGGDDVAFELLASR